MVRIGFNAGQELNPKFEMIFQQNSIVLAPRIKQVEIFPIDFACALQTNKESKNSQPVIPTPRRWRLRSAAIIGRGRRERCTKTSILDFTLVSSVLG